MKFFFTIAVILFICTSHIYSEEKIIMSIINEEESSAFKSGEKFLKLISSKMGREIILKSIPGKRAAYMLTNGQIHAEFARIKPYEKYTDSCILVNDPIAELPLYVYTKKIDFDVNGWESLKPYSVVVVNEVIFEKEYMQEHNTHHVNSYNAAFKYLNAGRADICVSFGVCADIILNTEEFKDSGIKKLAKPVCTLKQYTFFSSKYPELSEEYRRALAEVKKEPLYNQYVCEALSK